MKEKNAAYGNTALSPLGIFSKLGAAEAIKARIDDKLARIANKGLNDDTEDTARDLVGYLPAIVIDGGRKKGGVILPFFFSCKLLSTPYVSNSYLTDRNGKF